MKLAISTFLATLLVVAPVVSGCAGEDAEGGGEAAYPPIGYTPPGDVPQPAGAPATAPPATAVAGPTTRTIGPPSGEVAIGDDVSSPGEGPTGDGPDQGAPADGTAEGGGYTDTDPAALSDFRTSLDPYGNWQDDPNYGTVWVPSGSVVGDDFTPYVSSGHWDYDDDYTWVSDYDWGWAPFHYGRWVYAAGPGWEWIPGRTYAGAWVSWRYGVGDWGYVGWAPLAPTWCWRGGVAVGLGYVPRAPYAFVGTGELFHPQVGSRVISGPQVAGIAAHTQPYVNPSAGRVAARPSVGGPPPSDLHIAPGAVAHTTGAERGLAQARAFARPTTAVSMGARAPVGGASFAPRTSPNGWSQSRTLGASPAYGASNASHFGGRMGYGFAATAASAPPMRSPSMPYSGRTISGATRYTGPSMAYRGTTTFRAPSYGGRSAPSYSGGSRSFGGGAAHSFSGGGVPRSFSGGASHSFSGGGGGFHGGSSGGFHGGGGGGHSGGHR